MYKLLKYIQLDRKYGNQKALFFAFFHKLYQDVKVFKNYFLTAIATCIAVLFGHKGNPDYNRKCKILGSYLKG